jgi:hypothetical protein
MKQLVLAIALVACKGKSGWGQKTKAMADDVCACADKHCGDEKMRAFIKEMTTHKNDIGTDELEDIEAGEKAAEACIAKAK